MNSQGSPIHEHIKEMYKDLPEDRATGRTTSLAFYFIYQALSNPFISIDVMDHFMEGRELIGRGWDKDNYKYTSIPADKELLHVIQRIVSQTELKFIYLKPSGKNGFPTITYGDVNAKPRTN